MSASKPGRRKDRAIKALVWFHHWLGIATCLVFALWFASGAVLLFEPFPSLSREGQLAMQSSIQGEQIRVGPSQAIAAAGGVATMVRLVSRNGRATYVVGTDRATAIIDATSGRRLAKLSPADAAGIAARVGSEASVTPTSFDYDQWIVHNRFDPLRPFYRIDLTDVAGTRLYLSAVSGEVVQRTTSVQRGWNWVGAVLHWAYFTPLRSSFTAWDRFVWGLSLVALLVAIAGTVLGVIRTIAARRQSRPSLSFFRLKWLRWHHILGLYVSVFVLGWILSGWLSMDHGRLFSRGVLSPPQAAAYAGDAIGQGLRNVQTESLARIAGAREIDFSLVADQAILTAWFEGARSVSLDAEGHAMTIGAVDRLAVQGAKRVWGGSTPTQPSSANPDGIYASAEGWPATARVIASDGHVRPDLVFDGATGRVLTVNDESRKVYAWVYYALHTFNVPGLIERPTLRRVIVLLPLIAGFLFSVTGVVIGWRRLRKTAGGDRSRRKQHNLIA